MDKVADSASEGTETEALKAAFSVDAEKARGHLDRVVRSSVEQTLNSTCMMPFSSTRPRTCHRPSSRSWTQ